MSEKVIGKANRIDLFDNLKAVLIVTVVIGHFIGAYTGQSHILKTIWIYIYSFHMPLFLFVSGLMHKEYKTDDKLNRAKVCSFLICAYIMKILLGFESMVIGGSTMKFSLLSEKGIPWFLIALAVYEIIVYFSRDLKPSVILAIAVLLSIFISYDKEIGHYLILSRLVVFAPFYLLGYYMKPASVVEIAKKKYIKLLSLGIVVAFFVFCFIKTNWIYNYQLLFTGTHSFDSLSKVLPNANYLSRIFVMLVSFVMSFAVLMLIPNRNLGKVTQIGRKTLQIYFWHNFVRDLLNCFSVYKLLCNTLSHPVGNVVYVLLAVLLVVILSMPLFAHPTKEIFNIKRKEISQL